MNLSLFLAQAFPSELRCLTPFSIWMIGSKVATEGSIRRCWWLWLFIRCAETPFLLKYSRYRGFTLCACKRQQISIRSHTKYKQAFFKFIPTHMLEFSKMFHSRTLRPHLKFLLVLVILCVVCLDIFLKLHHKFHVILSYQQSFY